MITHGQRRSRNDPCDNHVVARPARSIEKPRGQTREHPGQTMTDLQKARADLPNVPESVFRVWLDPLLEQQPWDAHSRFWRDVFLYKGLTYWQKLRWVRTEFTLHPNRLSEATQTRLKQMEMKFPAQHGGSPFLLAGRHPPQAENHQPLHCPNRQGARPLVIHRGNAGIDILEGAHRAFMLLAHARSSTKPAVSLSMAVDAWVTM